MLQRPASSRFCRRAALDEPQDEPQLPDLRRVEAVDRLGEEPGAAGGAASDERLRELGEGRELGLGPTVRRLRGRAGERGGRVGRHRADSRSLVARRAVGS